MKRFTDILQSVLQGWYLPGPVNRLLLPVSWLYGTLVSLNRQSWEKDWRHPRDVGAKLIVVGNLTVGGTGKTPLVIALAEHFLSCGKNPGIVSRGYGGRDTTVPRMVCETDAPEVVGDEALLLKYRSGVPVSVCRDRVAAAELLVSTHHCDLIISDDGLQHHRMHRDIEILVIDAMRGFGNGWCLPAGPLREPLSSMKDSYVQVWNGDGQMDSERGFGMTMVGSEACSLRDSDHRISLDQLSNQSVHAVAGLGNPERFFRHLELAGMLIERHAFPDHHFFGPRDFDFTDDGSVTLMTEKDAVKCNPDDISGELYYVPVSAHLSSSFFETVQRLLDDEPAVEST